MTALILPIAVRSAILRKELPILMAATGLTAALVWDGVLTRTDAFLLLAVFAVLIVWSIVAARGQGRDTLGVGTAAGLSQSAMPLQRALTWLALGLLVLVVSSRLLVWGAVAIAQALGLSDAVIGLTVMAIGTSPPELAANIAAARKGEADIALDSRLIEHTGGGGTGRRDRADGHRARAAHPRTAGDGRAHRVAVCDGLGLQRPRAH